MTTPERDHHNILWNDDWVWYYWYICSYWQVLWKSCIARADKLHTVSKHFKLLCKWRISHPSNDTYCEPNMPAVHCWSCNIELIWECSVVICQRILEIRLLSKNKQTKKAMETNKFSQFFELFDWKAVFLQPFFRTILPHGIKIKILFTCLVLYNQY